jgi:hypothetical protein
MKKMKFGRLGKNKMAPMASPRITLFASLAPLAFLAHLSPLALFGALKILLNLAHK